MSSFDRGFKSWAERCSLGFRRELDLKPHDPLSVTTFSQYLGVELWTPLDVKGLPSECVKQLLEKDPNGWSGLTLSFSNQHIVIYNPKHSKKRQSSDIMHELSHIIIGHESSKMILSADGVTVMRSFDKKQEDEAAWLSGCLLLPREALLYVKQTKLSEEGTCSQYLVTLSLLRYRLHISGVNRQLHRRKI